MILPHLSVTMSKAFQKCKYSCVFFKNNRRFTKVFGCSNFEQKKALKGIQP